MFFQSHSFLEASFDWKGRTFHQKQKLCTETGETLEDISYWALIPFSGPFACKSGPLLKQKTAVAYQFPVLSVD